MAHGSKCVTQLAHNALQPGTFEYFNNYLDKNWGGGGNDNGCFRVRGLDHTKTAVTQATCQKQAKWLGRGELFTIIDSPGEIRTNCNAMLFLVR